MSASVSIASLFGSRLGVFGSVLELAVFLSILSSDLENLYCCLIVFRLNFSRGAARELWLDPLYFLSLMFLI